MKDDTRQRMIYAVQSDSSITIDEAETTITFTKADDRFRVFSSIPTVMRKVLAHPEFEPEIISQRSGDGYKRLKPENADEEFDGRRPVVGVKGTLPVGALKISSSSRANNHFSGVVGTGKSEFELSKED